MIEFKKGDRVCHAEDTDFKGTVSSQKGPIVLVVWDDDPNTKTWEFVINLRVVIDEG
jgi:hypothetical protein